VRRRVSTQPLSPGTAKLRCNSACRRRLAPQKKAVMNYRTPNDPHYAGFFCPDTDGRIAVLESTY
jgi:hypothetical protein